VAADPEARRLFIADSGHHRVVVASLEGAVQQVIGSGEAGLQDGPLSTTRFNNPQGMALWGQSLFIADTDNHAVRCAYLDRGQVETVAGTGEQALAHHDGGPAREAALSSPWDLAVHNGVVFIAMAGMHQLWALDLQAGQALRFAGSGAEGLQDGPLLSASLAQPSGLTSDGEHLYFADSETSSIRRASLDSRARVSTVVGADLFVFGDADGVGDAVRLQHPLGVCHHDGTLYVADTYNHKVKRVFPRTRGCTTFLGDGQPGLQDGPGLQARLYEPGGLAVVEGKLYIADTNNHALRVADLATGVVSTLGLRGL
jgi:sugar lactone lactonase YvrE